MYGLLTAAVIAALAAVAPGQDPSDNTLSPVDIPGVSAPVIYTGIAMAQPDRDPDTVTCRMESQPDTRFKKRICAHRRDRQALEALEQDHLMVYQRGFCGGGELCAN